MNFLEEEPCDYCLTVLAEISRNTNARKNAIEKFVPWDYSLAKEKLKS